MALETLKTFNTNSASLDAMVELHAGVGTTRARKLEACNSNEECGCVGCKAA